MPIKTSLKSAKTLASTVAVSTSPYAPKSAAYLVLDDNSLLSGARTLSVGSGLSSTDGGEGETFELSASDASTSAKGAVKLAGDLGGEAATPTVLGVHDSEGIQYFFGAFAEGDILKVWGGKIVGETDPTVSLTDHLDTTANPHPQYVQVVADANVNNGYPRLTSTGKVGAAQAPYKSVYATGGAQAMVPADIGALSAAGGTLSGALDLSTHKITHLADGEATSDAVNLGQVTQLLSGLDWQTSVIRQDWNTAPTSPTPSSGDRYLVAAGATGGGNAWAGQSGKIAQYGGSSWGFTAPNKGMTVHVESGTGGGVDMLYNGTAWVNIGSSVDHGALLNLTTGDPHTQYQTRAEKDANGGYCSLDGGGRVGATHAPAKSVYATGGNQALAPGDIGAEPAISTLPIAKGGTNASTASAALASLGAVAKAGDSMTGDLNLGNHRVTNLADAAASGDAVTLNQLNLYAWQAPVRDAVRTTPPGGVTTGQRHIIATGATGAWSGHDAEIAQWNGAAWAFTVGSEGMAAWATIPDQILVFDGSAWSNVGTKLSHADLQNLTTGNPHTQYQLTGDRGASNGYAPLDVNARVPAANAPNKSTYATGGNQAMAPADIGAVATGRQVLAGTGLTGGGDLSADRTLGISGFTGAVAKDLNPGTQTYASGPTVLATYDVGADAQLLVIAVRLPATTNAQLSTEVVLGLDNSTDVILNNTNTGSPRDLDLPTLALALMGDLANNAANNGRRIKQVRFQVNNSGGSLGATITQFRLRALSTPRGGGAAL